MSASKILSVDFPDKAALYAAYMPFVKNGGLFVRTRESFEMGEELFVIMTMMGEPQKYQLAGRVIWVTPPGAQSACGVGLQFHLDTPKELRQKLETYLAGSEGADRRTDTM